AEAAARIAGLVRATPLVAAAALSRASGADAFLTLRNLQGTGSFKLRGAPNAALVAIERCGAAAVSTLVARSAGNRGRAVAHVARSLGLPAAVFVSRRVPEAQWAARRALGGELHVVGDSQGEAEAVA